MNDYYKPSDDTFLLAECLQNASGRSALEIGAGSGYICEILTKHFKTVVATDIDLDAITQAKENVRGVMFLCCDSSSAVTNMKFDLVVMNPPYLPSETIKDLAVDGGKDGIEISIKMARDAIRLLHGDGKIMIVVSSLANYRLLMERLNDLGLRTEIIGERKLGFEQIMVMQASFRHT
jgi:release factor glutamine methyltransferase